MQSFTIQSSSYYPILNLSILAYYPFITQHPQVEVANPTFHHKALLTCYSFPIQHFQLLLVLPSLLPFDSHLTAQSRRVITYLTAIHSHKHWQPTALKLAWPLGQSVSMWTRVKSITFTVHTTLPGLIGSGTAGEWTLPGNWQLSTWQGVIKLITDNHCKWHARCSVSTLHALSFRMLQLCWGVGDLFFNWKKKKNTAIQLLFRKA